MHWLCVPGFEGEGRDSRPERDTDGVDLSGTVPDAKAGALGLVWFFVVVTISIKVMSSERDRGQRGFLMFLWHVSSTFDIVFQEEC